MANLINCFASDNCSGAHPRIMDALNRANAGYEISYGDDKYTSGALNAFKNVFGASARTYFVYNGTGANTLALGSVMRPYHAAIVPYTSHINIDETGAPERYTGCKIITVDSSDGKLYPKDIVPYLETQGVMHHSQIKIASITNPTETGTLYTLAEIKALVEFLHEKGLLLHMDGARIANAAAALNCTLAEMTTDCGVDILSFGGTKNGLMFGEAVVFLNDSLGEDFMYIRKNGTQLHSKMRFISCQYEEYLKDGLWLENARHANEMAAYLYGRLKEIEGVEPACETTCNSVFMILPEDMKARLLGKYYFYDMDMGAGKKASRLMCSFDTKKEYIDSFINLAKI
jgi:threonine aldolase